MAAMDTRHPPRFVPTLTDVVPDAETMLAAPNFAVSQEHLPEPADASFVQDVAESAAPLAKTASAPELPTQQCLVDIAQSMQANVMARLDEALEERLRYALADMVQLHTQSLYQAIRADVERLVSSAVHEAIAQELAHMRSQTDQL